MSILVKVFDEKLAKQELKKCPKIVQDYVKLLEKSIDRWKDINKKALKKLRENKISFERWCEELDRIYYIEAGYKNIKLNYNDFKDYYDEGLTPAQTLLEDNKHY